ncbi:hypothetical protein BKA63DRAFT_527982 [Paraphoma chrysanthemicola]|nr:hypothetical protein BKA63DRAFT_527982 [Paraphoma chrysanthemicola]
MTRAEPPSASMTASSEGYVSRLRSMPRRIWRAIRLAFITIELFGGSVIFAALLSGVGKSKERDNANDNNPSDDQNVVQLAHRSARGKRFAYLKRLHWIILDRLRQLFRPNSYWIPMATSILLLVYSYQALETHSMEISSTEEYASACPESGRRTQTSVWVKLFAASVTTICIHGHSGSLAGAHLSWRREIIRVMEVVISPLTPVVLFLGNFWYSFIDTLALMPGTWSKNVTLRYRLARLCYVCLHTGAPTRLQLALVNPVHILHEPQQRDLKWFGRVLILVVFCAQYIQAGLLLTRRIMSGTSAHVDFAMSFLVISGLVALFRSLTISLINSTWTVRADSLPCVEKSCFLPSCITFKDEQGFKNPLFLIVFGHDVANIPRTILCWIAAGYAQITIMLHDRMSPQKHLIGMFGIHTFWIGLIHVYFTSGFGDQLAGLNEQETNQDTNTDTNEQALPRPVHENANMPTSSVTCVNIVFHTVVFTVSLAVMAFTALGIFIHLYYIIGPCIMQYYLVQWETNKWKHMNATAPCPQLWKDGLEDELWWF